MNDTSVHKPTARVLAILEALAANSDGLTLTEIAETIHAAKGTIFPVLQTLSSRKFIIQNPRTGKYQIGISAFCVGESYTNNKTAMQFITEEMHAIVDQVGEICQMGILDNGDVLYIAKVDNKEAIRLTSYVGKRLPAYCTALGKAILSGYSLSEIKKLYPDGLQAYTPKTITSFAVLNRELEEVRKTKVAFESEETGENLCCVAVPLVADDKIIAALSVSAPTFRVNQEKNKLIAQALLLSKNKIETYFSSGHFNINHFIFQ